MRWHKASRRPRSQPGRQSLSGWLGRIVFEGPCLEDYTELISTAAFLQVGPGVTYGLGSVAVRWDEPY
ncbi:MAG: hypothetical protein AAGA48_38065 [Myxococcota bacterium]